MDYQIKSYGQLEPYSIASLCVELSKMNKEHAGYYQLFENNPAKSPESIIKMNIFYKERLTQIIEKNEKIVFNKCIQE